MTWFPHAADIVPKPDLVFLRPVPSSLVAGISTAVGSWAHETSPHTEDSHWRVVDVPHDFVVEGILASEW